jgi:superfamily I DNA/RNA helicase
VAIWRVLRAFEEGVRSRGGDDAIGLGARAIHALLGGAVTSPWWGVVCDEVQDASLVDLRLLSLVGGSSLFLVGDGHQRLYTRPVSLRAAGIEVRGRSVRLRLNYRTTQGICRAAVAVMDGVDLDTLDVEARADDASDDAFEKDGGYRSVRAGPLPERHVCADADAEADVVADVIRASSSTDGAAPTLVLARTRAALSALQERLRVRGLTVALLGDGVERGDVTGVPAVLATLHRAKGLEAPTVVLTAMQQVPQPFRGGADDDVGRALHERQERSLVYVGMTRARDRCVLTRVGP